MLFFNFLGAGGGRVEVYDRGGGGRRGMDSPVKLFLWVNSELFLIFGGFGLGGVISFL